MGDDAVGTVSAVPPLRRAKPHAIPTMYKGVQMRSRLEARWAAFFDTVGWQWNYEPPEFAGWIPDFQITTTGLPLLVEVKPAGDLADVHGQEAVRDIQRCLTGKPYESVILGNAPFTVDGLTYLGWMPEPDQGGMSWDRAAVGTIIGDQLCLCHSSGSFRCRICGADEGWCAAMPPTELEACWAKACNLTQWRPTL